MQYSRNLDRALMNSGVTVIYQGLDMRVRWSRNVPAVWSKANIAGQTDHGFMPPAEAARMLEIKRRVMEGSGSERTEIHVPTRYGGAWFDAWIDVDRDDDGQHVGMLTTAVEITEHKRREQTLKTLLREVSHRSKNLLAIIQGIANQTGRYSASIDAFLTSFRGRLQSLAYSQDLVTSSNWRGAALLDLATSQIGRYADPRVSLHHSGLNPYLNPNAAMYVGLALHELAVNSLSFGALSRPGGIVDLSARLSGDGKANGTPSPLILEWAESIEGSMTAFKEEKFGGVTLERVVPTSVDGQSTISIADGRLVYVLVMPAMNFELSPK